MRVQCDSCDGPVWRIRMSALPGRDIALSAQGLTDLIGLFAQAECSDRCRVVVLEGSNGTFCRGMDLGGLVDDPAATMVAGTRQYAQCLRQLRGSSKAVIALVDGAVVAGGVGLALAADIVVASRVSTFGLPEVALGLVPAMVLALLLERMAPHQARRWALSAQTIDAEQALQLGVVDRLADGSAELERALRAEINPLLRARPEAVARLKRLVTRMGPLGWEQALDAGTDCTAELLSQPATVDAVRAFLDGEPLPWFDRYRGRGGQP